MSGAPAPFCAMHPGAAAVLQGGLRCCPTCLADLWARPPSAPPDPSGVGAEVSPCTCVSCFRAAEERRAAALAELTRERDEARAERDDARRERDHARRFRDHAMNESAQLFEELAALQAAARAVVEVIEPCDCYGCVRAVADRALRALAALAGEP